MKLEETGFKTEAALLKCALSNMLDPANATWLPTIKDNEIIFIKGDQTYKLF